MKFYLHNSYNNEEISCMIRDRYPDASELFVANFAEAIYRKFYEISLEVTPDSKGDIQSVKYE